ncbi:phage repressor protein CI [Salmonella enterica subsp. enterica serovar Kiambu]|uniref:phage repressor protein CI n=1 Tax=Enterobacteriaceae TaxID=543 RepID=UPI00079A626E|nr:MULTISPECIES: phage repressor protein CI [Enterobacteriaceae]EAV5169647.1 phage repressor protein CI [Salmonella enterica]EBQ6170833.1 phage repressor protein CI [Salmonella enterica subsp. enterica serovar Derby]EBU7035107.1 phage repressor protein CI [Salmonella enterica subsp. enterica serovar Indiana]ELI7003261.1 phage repressor protein CI [Citrobacter freundii]BBW32875.1 repressor [Enterobacter cloacae]HDT1678744.1 phage repressor protein CI [Enterobacter hormaechei subsp. steigerwalt
MRIDSLGWSNVDVLDRICEAYGFSQKIQLANHFDIASSSLSNRYTRGAISYDFAAHCALETGANLQWLLTGKGQPFTSSASPEDTMSIESFTLSEEILKSDGSITVDAHFFTKPLPDAMVIRTEGKLHFIDKQASLSDGLWLVDIEGGISIRELTKLPGRKLHVTGGKVPFECGIDDIKTLGRVVGVYSEVN